MELIGSNTSPFVRRIRMLLHGRPYTYTALDIFNDDRDTLARHSPVMKIPVLIDRGRQLYDSRVIARYLQQTHGIGRLLSWEEENQLTIIDGALDSMVTLLLSQRSGLASDDQSIAFYRLQHERIRLTLAALEGLLEEGVFRDWAYPAQCLYTLIDWASFRQLIVLDDYPQLQAFRQQHGRRDEVIASDPRD